MRLAQCVPVRIALDPAERSELVAGATATVEVIGSGQVSEGHGVRNRNGVPHRLACRAVQLALGSSPVCG